MGAELLITCVVAFVAVFVLLALLAFVMRVLVAAFPQPRSETDAAVIAAVTSVVTTLYPGTQVTNVEEVR
jgi:hypothetical protein